MQLEPGLTPDVVERLRWHAFGQKRALVLRNAADLVRFTAERGIVLVNPAAGLHYPSVLEAVVGRPLLEHLRDERGAEIETWCDEGASAKKFVRAVFVDRRDSLVDQAFVADVVAAGGRHGAAVASAAGLGAVESDATRGAAARERIAERVLRNVLVVTSEELAQLMGWDELAARAALAALAERGAASVHPSTRPRRLTYQAAESELVTEV
jgi:hypothetical protein